MNNTGDKMADKQPFKRTGSEDANQIGASSPYKGETDNPQGDASYSSADNDMDRQTAEPPHLKNDAEEAQSDGDLSFPPGK